MTSTTRQAILHVSDRAEDVQRAVAAAGTLASADPTLRVRVIVNGPALAGVTEKADAITPGGGTTVEACSLGMRRRGMPVDALQGSVGSLESAISAIVEAQLAGAAYVRI